MFRSLKLTLLDSMLWFFWFPFRKTIQWLPLQLSCAAGLLLAWIGSRLLVPVQREIAEDLTPLLADSYSAKEINSFARKSIQIDLQRRIEELILPTLTADSVQKLVTIEGEEYLEQARASGRGTIVLLSHFGSFLTILPALGFQGYPVNQLGGAPTLKHHRKIHATIFKTRKNDYNRLPVRFLRADRQIRAVLGALKNNELVAIAFDGRVSNSWVKVRFFNKDAWFAPGVVKMACKTGATLLPTFIVRDRFNHHRLIFEKPVQLVEPLQDNDFIESNMQNIANIFEEKIHCYPCHFAMIMYINKKRAAQGSIDQAIFS